MVEIKWSLFEIEIIGMWGKWRVEMCLFEMDG
jgi:hypothetical protein